MTKYSLPHPAPLKNPYSPFRNFNYIRPIRIKGSTEDLRDYQIKIVLNKNNFPLEKCKSDGSDIRFRDETGEVLSYWIESWTSDEAIVWCKVPYIPAHKDKKIWMVYGNPAAVSASDGDATFDFFDDFEPAPAYTLKGIVEAGAIENTPIATTYPTAFHYNGLHDRTYFVYLSDTFEHRILYYDHDSQSWSSSVKVADCVENDLHENPAITIDNGGYIYVFYNAHGNMRMKKSTNPEDITSWGSAIDPTDGYGTYPKCFVDSSNTIYLLHMHHGSDSPNVLAFTKSTDGGNTWANETIVVNLGSDYCYAFKAIIDSSDTIHLAFSIYDSSESSRRDVFYMQSTDGGDTWQKADGTSISIPAGEGDVDKAYDSVGFCQGFDLVIDSNNYPIMAYSDDKVYGIVRWNGSTWESHSLGVSTDDVFNNIRLQVISDTTYRAWLFTDASISGRGGELKVYETTDNGANWTKIKDVTTDSPLLHRNITIPEDYNSEIEAIWNYGNWTDENGPDCDILFYGTAPPVFIKEMGTNGLDSEKWEVVKRGTGTATVSNGMLILHPSDTDWDTTLVKTKNTYAANNICVEARIFMNCKRYLQFGFGDVTGFAENTITWLGTKGYYHLGKSDADGKFFELVDDNTPPSMIGVTTDWPPEQAWFKEAICYTSDGTLRKFQNDNPPEIFSDTTWLSDEKKGAISASQISSNGGDIHVDWFRIRKYIYPEPVIIL